MPDSEAEDWESKPVALEETEAFYSFGDSFPKNLCMHACPHTHTHKVHKSEAIKVGKLYYISQKGKKHTIVFMYMNSSYFSTLCLTHTV